MEVLYMAWIRGGGNSALFVHFSIRAICGLANYQLNLLNHIHIWQVAMQLSCGDICCILKILKNEENYWTGVKIIVTPTTGQILIPASSRKNRVLFQYKDPFSGIGIPIIKVRWSWVCHPLFCWHPELTIIPTTTSQQGFRSWLGTG